MKRLHYTSVTSNRATGSGSWRNDIKVCQELLLLNEVRHENLCPFIGCLEEDDDNDQEDVVKKSLTKRVYLCWEYCVHGSLTDVFALEGLVMDFDFKLALLADLVKVLST